MPRLLLAMTLILLTVSLALGSPARAAPPTSPARPSASPFLRKAKALIDRMARDLALMTGAVEAAGGDQARIKAIGDRFKTQAESMRTEGEALRKRLTEAENRELETYANEKIAPLTGRLLAAMMKSQMASQGSPPSSQTEERESEPVRPATESSEVVAARTRMDTLVVQLGKLTAEVLNTGDASKLAAIERRMRALLAQGHDDEHAAYRKIKPEERTELRQYRDLHVEAAVRRLRRAIDRAGQADCPDMLRARAMIDAYAQDLKQLQARVLKARGVPKDLDAITKSFEELQERRNGQLDELRELLAQDEVDDFTDALDEKVEPLRKALEDALAPVPHPDADEAR
jgi:hypothetical protein